MGISIDRFKTVVLEKPIDLEAQLYTKSLDATPNTVWQSILLWLTQLLMKTNSDQFDSVQIAQNIDRVFQELSYDFFDSIDIVHVEQGIINLEALKSKFAENPLKKDEVERCLSVPLKTLRAAHRKKESEEHAREHQRSLEEKKVLEEKFKQFVQSQGANDAFKQEVQSNDSFKLERRNLTVLPEDCSYLGIDNLRKVYLQNPEAAEQNPAQLFKIAKTRKQRTANFNKDRLSEIGTYFKDSKGVLALLFPAYKEKQAELKKMLKEGTITFEHEHINLLSQAIRNPVEAKESAERTARTYKNNPLFNETPEEKENKRILGELVLLRNDTPVKHVEPTTFQQLVPRPVVIVPEPVEPPAPVVESTQEQAVQMATNIMETAVEMGGDLTEKAAQVTEDVANKAYEVGKGIFDMAANATEGLGDAGLVGRVRETSGEFMEKAVEATGNLGEIAYEKGGELMGMATKATGDLISGVTYEKGGELMGMATKVTGDLSGIAYEKGGELASKAYETGGVLAEKAYEQGGKLAGAAAETAVKGLSSAVSYVGKGATTALFNGVAKQVFWG